MDKIVLGPGKINCYYFMNLIKSGPAIVSVCMLIFLSHCTKSVREQESLSAILNNTESITGKTAYLNTPYITAGDRVYMVGHQNGTFPDLGWHVVGEMGGIWDHPIKLMDGFTAVIKENGQSICLSKADTFVNFPFANKHIFRTGLGGLEVERFQFAPDGKEAVVVEFKFTNSSANTRKIRFDFNGSTDLRPVWLGERTGMKDAGDFVTWNESTSSWIAKDSLNEWYTMFGSVLNTVSHQKDLETCDYKPLGKGCTASLSYDLVIEPNASFVLPLVISGSYESVEKVEATYRFVRDNTAMLLNEKKERYEKIASQTKLTIPDKNLERAFRWVKYNTDWLVRDVPEIGRGLSAGAPDYPWWFGTDSEYALRGLITTGRKQMVYDAIEVIHKLSEKANGNGRIVHEVSTNGAVFNPGNVNETPQFVTLVATVYAWTGDKDFLLRYFPTIKKGLNWLLKENDKDGNLLPDGFGMMEIHGMNSEMIDVAVYSQKAFADAAVLARELGEAKLAVDYSEIASKIRARINTGFWVAGSNSFADFIGTKQQAVKLIDDAIIRADTLKKPWAVSELRASKAALAKSAGSEKRGFVVHHNWVVNTPMETGIADSAKAIAALVTGGKFVNPFGAFVTGIDRDESAGKDENSVAGNNKVFTYTGAVMTLPTGVLAIAENNYGHPDKALGYLKRMTRSFSFALPGSIYEVSPDYGMMAQAWNIYSYAVPVVQQFFGIKPEASKKMIHIQPQMPTEWPEATLENVIVGNNNLSMTYKKLDKSMELTFEQSSKDWKIVLSFPKNKFKNWEVNGRKILPTSDGTRDSIELTGSKILVKIN